MGSRVPPAEAVEPLWRDLLLRTGARVVRLATSDATVAAFSVDRRWITLRRHARGPGAAGVRRWLALRRERALPPVDHGEVLNPSMEEVELHLGAMECGTAKARANAHERGQLGTQFALVRTAHLTALPCCASGFLRRFAAVRVLSLSSSMPWMDQPFASRVLLSLRCLDELTLTGFLLCGMHFHGTRLELQHCVATRWSKAYR